MLPSVAQPELSEQISLTDTLRGYITNTQPT